MWQTPSDEPLEKRLISAIDHYQRKYGRRPNAAKVSTKLLDAPAVVQGVTVQPLGSIAVNMLWLGVEDAIEGVAERAQELVDLAEEMVENEIH